MTIDFIYLRQNSQRNNFGNLAYSCGYGEEYLEFKCQIKLDFFLGNGGTFEHAFQKCFYTQHVSVY
jgi:hypothetical protein